MLSWSNSLGTNLTHFLRFHLWMLGVSSSSACSGGSWESVYCVLLSQTPEIEGDSPPEGCCTSSVRIGIRGVFHVGSMPEDLQGPTQGAAPYIQKEAHTASPSQERWEGSYLNTFYHVWSLSCFPHAVDFDSLWSPHWPSAGDPSTLEGGWS